MLCKGLAHEVALALAGGVLRGAPCRRPGGRDSARQLYNQGRYDQAITAAAQLAHAAADGRMPPTCPWPVPPRAFPQDAGPTPTWRPAREALREVRPARLAASDRIDYLVGLGEPLYLEESYGPAAEVFRTALDRSLDLGPRAFERVFDWWATALDRQAQSGMVDDREAVYARDPGPRPTELARIPGSSAAPYWLVGVAPVLR